MSKQFQFVFLLTLSGLLLSPSINAQENEPALPSAAEVEEAVPEEEVPAGQEVEINEDNYRQFMELKDANLQREIIPENVFKPGSGLQKLEKLPEESQKHLRNQLREIIVQGDEWQPGDEETEYPYTPSVAASTDASLEKQELEAWGELVDSYHDRESQIYENSSGSQAARGSEQGSSNSPENGVGATGSTGQDAEGSQGQQAGQEGNPDQSDSEGTYSLNGSNDPNANSTAGVSQNAMEFLRGLGKGGSGAGDGNYGNSAENSGQGESQEGEQGETQADGQLADAQGDGQDAGQEGDQADSQGNVQADSQSNEQARDGQQTESSESPASNVPPASTAPDSPIESEEESTAGASQNALDYLTGKDAQAVEGTNDEADKSQPEGTLTIQDLLNAKGLGNSVDPDPGATNPDEERKPDEIKSEKDSDG